MMVTYKNRCTLTRTALARGPPCKAMYLIYRYTGRLPPLQGAKDAGCLATIYINLDGEAPPAAGPKPDYIILNVLDVPELVDKIFDNVSDLTMAPIEDR